MSNWKNKYKNLTSYTCDKCGKEYKSIASEVKRHKHKFCSKECNYAFKKSGKTDNCFLCGVATKYKNAKALLRYKRTYCSTDCRNKDLNNNLELRPKKTGRSKLEIHLENYVKEKYSNLIILCNDRITCSGVELDFFFPDFNLAIEINGPTHYTPIYGQEMFDLISKNDHKKQKICEQKGIELIIIPDQGNFSQKKFQKIKESLDIILTFAHQRKQQHDCSV